MDNPYVNIIGHPDDSRYPVDYEQLVRAAGEKHVLLELNNTSQDQDREHMIMMLQCLSFAKKPAYVYLLEVMPILKSQYVILTGLIR